MKKFFEHKSTKRVVHFLGRSDRDKVFIPEGSATQDGRSPGLSVEMPRSASHREILETLCQRLDSVRDPLLLRVSPMTAGGKPQVCAMKNVCVFWRTCTGELTGYSSSFSNVILLISMLHVSHVSYLSRVLRPSSTLTPSFK